MNNQPLTSLTPDATLAQIISANEQAESLLTSIGLVPSNHKDETLRSVCQQRKWSEVEVLNWVKKHSEDSNSGVNKRPDNDAGLRSWLPYWEEELIAKNLKLLQEITDTFPLVLKIHGNQYAWLKNMHWHFDKFEEAFKLYCRFEREKFVPLVEQLLSGKQSMISYGTFSDLQQSFSVISRDQYRLQRLMNRIQQKGKGFENPGVACSTLRIQNKNFKILFSGIEEQIQVEKVQLIPRMKELMKVKL